MQFNLNRLIWKIRREQGRQISYPNTKEKPIKNFFFHFKLKNTKKTHISLIIFSRILKPKEKVCQVIRKQNRVEIRKKQTNLKINKYYENKYKISTLWVEIK